MEIPPSQLPPDADAPQLSYDYFFSFDFRTPTGEANMASIGEANLFLSFPRPLLSQRDLRTAEAHILSKLHEAGTGRPGPQVADVTITYLIPLVMLSTVRPVPAPGAPTGLAYGYFVSARVVLNRRGTGAQTSRYNQVVGLPKPFENEQDLEAIGRMIRHNIVNSPGYIQTPGDAIDVSVHTLMPMDIVTAASPSGVAMPEHDEADDEAPDFDDDDGDDAPDDDQA